MATCRKFRIVGEPLPQHTPVWARWGTVFGDDPPDGLVPAAAGEWIDQALRVGRASPGRGRTVARAAAGNRAGAGALERGRPDPGPARAAARPRPRARALLPRPAAAARP